MSNDEQEIVSMPDVDVVTIGNNNHKINNHKLETNNNLLCAAIRFVGFKEGDFF